MTLLGAQGGVTGGLVLGWQGQKDFSWGPPHVDDNIQVGVGNKSGWRDQGATFTKVGIGRQENSTPGRQPCAGTSGTSQTKPYAGELGGGRERLTVR